jgi:hypothetical protein
MRSVDPDTAEASLFADSEPPPIGEGSRINVCTVNRRKERSWLARDAGAPINKRTEHVEGKGLGGGLLQHMRQ